MFDQAMNYKIHKCQQGHLSVKKIMPDGSFYEEICDACKHNPIEADKLKSTK